MPGRESGKLVALDSSQATRWSMIRGAAEGRAVDRSLFARRYLPLVRTYLSVRWAGSSLSADVDDATQEVFLDCFRSDGPLARARDDRPGGFRPYLYGIARIVALRFERKRAARRSEHAPRALAPERLASGDASPSEAFDRAWAVAILEEARDLHRERAKRSDSDALRRAELLRLRFQEGLPIREIALRWGVDPMTLHRAYPKARSEFRRALVDTVAFHHGGTPAQVERHCRRLLALL